jgi:hypothetical protein
MVGVIPREVTIRLEPYLGVVTGEQELFPVAHSSGQNVTIAWSVSAREGGRHSEITLAAIRYVQ